MTEDQDGPGGEEPAAGDSGTADHARTAREEPLTRVCRRCSTQTTGSGRFCPNCGKSYERRRRIGRRGAIALAAVALVLVGGGVTAAVLVDRHNDAVAAEKAEKVRAAEEERREAERAEQERERRAEERRKRMREAKVELRRETVRSLRRSITGHAKDLVDDGLLSGPILRTECDPTGGGNIDDVAQHTGNFSCMAVTEIDDDGTMTGYTYEASINYETGRYRWGLER